MALSSSSHPSHPPSSKHSLEGSDTKTAQPSSLPQYPPPISSTLARLRSLPSGPTRPPTPIPLRPGAPPTLRVHSRLPSNLAPMYKPCSSPVPPLRKSPKSSSPVRGHSKMGLTFSESEAKIRPRRIPQPLAASCDWNTVKPLGRGAVQQSPPTTPTSPRTPRGVLSSRNGSISKGHAIEQPSDTDGDASLILPSLDGNEKENHSSHIILPATPNSPVFPPSMSDSLSVNSTKSPSAKSVRWAEIAVFPEQQCLLNIHGLLKTLIEESEEDIKDVCILLQDYLPQPGALSERKYTLRSTQEAELEHALRILDGALYRNLDPIAVDKAKRTLKRLAPIIQRRFATLPAWREVERLKAERLQLKEERALVLVQLAIQESEIKSAQLRREAERNREIEEAAMRRTKRREEKMREKQTYLGFRKLLEERSEELMELNQRITSENERLLAARQERDKKNLDRTQKGTLPLRVGLGGSVRMTSVRQGDWIKCWI